MYSICTQATESAPPQPQRAYIEKGMAFKRRGANNTETNLPVGVSSHDHRQITDETTKGCRC